MNRKTSEKKYAAAVLAAGFFWGFMGFFTRHLNDVGIETGGAVFLRCGIAAICFFLLIIIKNPKELRVRRKDVWCFLGSGLMSLLFFTWCYFQAIQMMSLSTAAILLYTAPTIVMLLSAVFFREKITGRKLIAVVISFIGCALVSGITGGTAVTLKGVLFGLGSGIGYALYSIFARFALDRGYSSGTVTFYSCLLAAAGAGVLWGVREPISVMFSSGTTFLWCLATGAISCFLAYMLYTYGLTGLENGKASVLASVEPVVASVIGVIAYHEKMSVFCMIGMALVLTAIVLLNTGSKNA